MPHAISNNSASHTITRLTMVFEFATAASSTQSAIGGRVARLALLGVAAGQTGYALDAMSEQTEDRYFAHFITTRDDEAARSLRTLVDLPASAEEIAGICAAEHLGATLMDLEGRTVGHVDENGRVTLK